MTDSEKSDRPHDRLTRLSTALPPGTCPVHGTYIGPYCPGCVTVPPPPTTRPLTSGRVCDRCGEAAALEARYCVRCGKALS